MKFLKLTKKGLTTLLEDFAHDLTNHSIRVDKDGEPSLPPQSKNLINVYISSTEEYES